MILEEFYQLQSANKQFVTTIYNKRITSGGEKKYNQHINFVCDPI